MIFKEHSNCIQCEIWSSVLDVDMVVGYLYQRHEDGERWHYHAAAINFPMTTSDVKLLYEKMADLNR